VLLGTVTVLYVATLVRTGGRWIYPLDDPAIHLSVARRLAYDGTWGVVAGHYQAASSSPLWTLLLAPTQWVVRGHAGEQVPIVLNLLAGLAVVALLAPDWTALRPASGRGARALWAVASVVLVVLVLYLPGLAVMGMEHTLHMALVLAAALATEARWVRPPDAGWRWFRSAPFVLTAVAAAARGETTFVAVALAAALVAVGWRRWRSAGYPSASLRTRLVAGVGLGASAGAALAVFGAVNLVFGQEILPNSVILKSLGDRGDTRRSFGAAWERLMADHLLGAFLLVAVVVLVVAARRRSGPGDLRPAVFPALVTGVAILVHIELGAVEASSRYEAYLFGLGAWTVLRALPAAHAALAGRWPTVGARVPAAALLLVVIPAAALQGWDTFRAPRESGITYEQRYQVARFLADHYRHDPIAIGELGYISLYHDGPLTDVYGLGDHEVLEARMADHKNAAFWDHLQRRRGFDVVVTYDFTMFRMVPEGWYSVAAWRNPSAQYPVTRFWATTPEQVAPLADRLHAYEPRLPDAVEVSYNQLAPLAAARELCGREGLASC
jgi:hypothetical protein